MKKFLLAAVLVAIAAGTFYVLKPSESAPSSFTDLYPSGSFSDTVPSEPVTQPAKAPETETSPVTIQTAIAPGARYSFDVEEVMRADCADRAPVYCDVVRVFENGRLVGEYEGEALITQMGGWPIEWIDEKTLLTRAWRGDGGYAEETFYRYDVETKVKTTDLMHATSCCGGELVMQLYASNGPVHYVTWLQPDTQGHVMLHISTLQPGDTTFDDVHDRSIVACKTTTPSNSDARDICYLEAFKPLVTYDMGAYTEEELGQYSIALKRKDASSATLSVSKRISSTVSSPVFSGELRFDRTEFIPQR